MMMFQQPCFSKLIVKKNDTQSVITDLQPLPSFNQHNQSLLWYGTLHSDTQAPKAVVVKQLTPSYSKTNLAHLQQEWRTLVHCHNLAFKKNTYFGNIPTPYLSNLDADTHIFYSPISDTPAPPCFVMSYHNGYNLKSLMNASRHYPILSFMQKMTIFLNICQAVNQLHQFGVLHLDIKPANIIIEDNFKVTLIDLGLSQMQINENLSNPIRKQFTAGTPAYMSPEQLTGQILDQRSDYYSLGIVLFEWLTRALPFYATNLHEWTIAHCQSPVPYLSTNEQLSTFECQACQAFIDCLLAKNTHYRIDSLDKVINSLKVLLNL